MGFQVNFANAEELTWTESFFNLPSILPANNDHRNIRLYGTIMCPSRF